MTNKNIAKLNQYEQHFSQKNYSGDIKNNSVFSYINHGSHVCLTAPHATNSTVHKSFKCADWFTGGIVSYVGEKVNFSYIVRNRYLNKKCMISSFVQENNLERHYFLDIHAMKDRPFDLAVGTGYLPTSEYKKELAFIKKLCSKYKIKYVINHPSYTGQPGLTGRIQHFFATSNVLQLEWTNRYRDFNEFSENVLNITIPFITELSKFLDTLEKKQLNYAVNNRYNFFQKLKNRLRYLLGWQ